MDLPRRGESGRRRASRTSAAWAAALATWAASAPVDTTVAPEPSLELIAQPTTFGDVEIGDVGEVMIDVRNRAGPAIRIDEVRLLPTDGEFSVTEDGCSDSELGRNATCRLTVAFQPAVEGRSQLTVELETSVGTVRTVIEASGLEPAAAATDVPGTSPTGTEAADASEPPVPTTTVAGLVPTTPPIVPTSTAPPSTSDPLVSDSERLARCEQRAANAQVSFHRTATMTVGDATPFIVTVSLVTGDPGQSTTSVPSGVTVEEVSLRCEVQAQLRGADFRVEPGDFQQGSFLDRSAIDWSWDVVPLEAGTSALTLDIRSVVVIDGRRIEGAGGQLYTSTITVVAEDESLWARSKRWSGELVDHPLIRGFGSLVVVGGALAGAWRGLLKRPWPWADGHRGTKRPATRRSVPPRRRRPKPAG